MRGAPQSWFSVLICRISARNSISIRGRLPRGFDFQRQYRRKPARCHRTSVSGWTIVTTVRIDGNHRYIWTRNQRSLLVSRARPSFCAAKRSADVGAPHSPPQALSSTRTARPARPEQTKPARSSRQFSRFCYAKNPDRVFGTHRSVCAALDPLLRLVEAHVMAAARLHADDTTVPVLASGKTDTGRCWIYVRDDRPFGGAGPPAAMFYYSRDRKGEHPQAHLARYVGILQADAYDGYHQLYLAGRNPGPIREATCWAHARRPFFAMADIEENARRKAAGKKEIVLSPIAIEVVHRIDALFEIERSINGKRAEDRLAVRQTLSRPLIKDLHAYMREQVVKLSRGHDLAKAFNYILKRWASFTLFLEDGRVCLSNNAAERGLRGIAMRESLCTPSSSVCKHWKRVRVDNATRATFPGHRRFDRLRRQVVGTDLMRCAGNNLHSRKDTGFDKAPYGVVCDA